MRAPGYIPRASKEDEELSTNEPANVFLWEPQSSSSPPSLRQLKRATSASAASSSLVRRAASQASCISLFATSSTSSFSTVSSDSDEDSSPLSPSVCHLDLSKLTPKERAGGGVYGGVYRGSYRGLPITMRVFEFGEARDLSRGAFATVRATFLREMALWRGLNHPNVAQCIGAFGTGPEGLLLGRRRSFRVGANQCCVVVAGCPEGSLKSYLQRHRWSKLPLTTVMLLALGLARGLQHLHQNKLVHGDISTETLLLTPQKRVQITDVGVARVDVASFRERKVSPGALGSLAPEVLEGLVYGEKADVYSFGVCLWEIYCCDDPFPKMSSEEMTSFVRTGHRPDIPEVCPPKLATIMRSCWEASPRMRPDISCVVARLEDVDPVKGQGMPPVRKSHFSKRHVLL